MLTYAATRQRLYVGKMVSCPAAQHLFGLVGGRYCLLRGEVVLPWHAGQGIASPYDGQVTFSLPLHDDTRLSAAGGRLRVQRLEHVSARSRCHSLPVNDLMQLRKPITAVAMMALWEEGPSVETFTT